MKYQKPATERVMLIGRMNHDSSGIVICPTATVSLIDCIPNDN